jgi:hypothetical protein
MKSAATPFFLFPSLRKSFATEISFESNQEVSARALFKIPLHPDHHRRLRLANTILPQKMSFSFVNNNTF